MSNRSSFLYRRVRAQVFTGARLGTAMAFAAVLSCAPFVATAQDVDWKVGKLGYLSQEIGTYNYARVLDDPAVKTALSSVLSPVEMRQFRDNLAVEAPIGFDGTSLVLRGNMAHAGTTEIAILAVRPRDGKIDGAFLHDGRVTAFTNANEFGTVSGAVSGNAHLWAQQSGAELDVRQSR